MDKTNEYNQSGLRQGKGNEAMNFGKGKEERYVNSDKMMLCGFRLEDLDKYRERKMWIWSKQSEENCMNIVKAKRRKLYRFGQGQNGGRYVDWDKAYNRNLILLNSLRNMSLLSSDFLTPVLLNTYYIILQQVFFQWRGYCSLP